MIVVGNTPSGLCRVLVGLWIATTVTSQPDGNVTTTTSTTAEVIEPSNNGSNTYDVTVPTSGQSAAEPILSDEDGPTRVVLAETGTQSITEPRQTATSATASQNGTQGGGAGKGMDIREGITTTAKINPPIVLATPAPTTTEKNVTEETRTINVSGHETTTQERRIIPASPSDGFGTVSPSLTDHANLTGINGTTESEDQNEPSASSPVASLPKTNSTDSGELIPQSPISGTTASVLTTSRVQMAPTGNFSTISGIDDTRTTTVKSSAPKPMAPITVPRTTPRSWTDKQNETVTTKQNMTSPYNASGIVKSTGLWRNCSTDCWGIAIGIPVAGVIIIALVLTISLLCIKPGRNYSVPKSSGSTELDSLNETTQYNTGEPPGVTTEVIAPECFTNLALNE